jgi:hypothetical protein
VSIFEDDTLKTDLGPVDIENAKNDEDAIHYAGLRASYWMFDHSILHATVAVLKDGSSLKVFPVKIQLAKK